MDNQTTPFFMSVFDLTSEKPPFKYHFEPPQLKGSYMKGKLGYDTIYETGTLGKLLTMYT